jgi:hypothetical protein
MMTEALKNPYGVKDSRGQWITEIRPLQPRVRALQEVLTWRCDADQPPLKMSRLKAQKFVQYVHSDPDIDGFTIHHLT